MRGLVLLLLTAMCMLNAAHAQTSRRVALLIGNSDYTNAALLANPRNDVELVANSLRTAGFQTVTVQRNVGIRAFQQALRDFRTRATGAQVALVYYAGHGMEANGHNWLIPVDAALLNDRDLPDEAIDLDRVMREIEGASLRMVVLDACRNNPFGRSWRAGTRAISRGLVEIEPDNVLVFYAAAPGQVAADGTGRNSPFAIALAKRLAEPGLSIHRLGAAVRDDVLASTGGQQRPFVSASISQNEFFFVKANTVHITDATPAAVNASVDPVALDLAMWQGALAVGTESAYQTYLRESSKGRFVGLAKDSIAKLTRERQMPPHQSAQVASVVAAAKVQIAQGENVVTLRVDGDLSIDPAGHVLDYRIRTKLDPEIGKLVAKAVPAWRFEPVLVNGKGIPAKSSMRITLAATEVKGGYEVHVDNIYFPSDKAFQGAIRAEWDRQADDRAAAVGADKPRQSVSITPRKLGPPSYPSGLEEAGVEGLVLLTLRLNPDGSVVDVFPSQSSLFNVTGKPELLDPARKMLEKNAAATAAKWTFGVKAKDMTALTASDLTVRVPVSFHLSEGRSRRYDLNGKWRHEFRGPNFPVPWLLAGDDQVIGVSDLDSGQVITGNSTFRLKDKSVIGKVL